MTMTSGSGFQSVETKSIVSGRDQQLVRNAAMVAAAAERVRRTLAPTISVIRDNQAGQPRAAHYEVEGGDDDRNPLAAFWCWDHERTVAECVNAGMGCEGELGAARPDPTGNAAISGDPALRDLARVGQLLERANRTMLEVAAIMAAYPVAAQRDDDEPARPGEDLCRSCWKSNKYPKLIERKSNGHPYYAGLCRWCGQMRKTLRGDRLGKGDAAGDPPTFLVDAHLSGTVTEGMVQKAQRQLDETVARRSEQADRQSKKKRKKK